LKKSTLSILLIDDSESDRNLFRHILTEIDPDIKYISINGGERALKYLMDSVTLPDYIFLDINMPGMNGIECLEKMKKNELIKNIPVIMYSTADGARYGPVAMELGASQYLNKSIDFFKSIEEIASIIIHVEVEEKRK
jgi:PleD family two-component response regulator